MDRETVDGSVVGCSHERFTTTAGRVSDILASHPGYHPRPKQGGVALASKEGADPTAEIAKLYDPKRKVEVVSYNMERFAKDCVTAFWNSPDTRRRKSGRHLRRFSTSQKIQSSSSISHPRPELKAKRINAPRVLSPRKRNRLPTREKDQESCRQPENCRQLRASA